MSDVTRSIRIPVSLDAEIEEHKGKLNISNRYKFFLTLGLKLFTHKTLFERKPELIEDMINKHQEILKDMEVSIQTEQFFKDLTMERLDSIQYLIRIERERREKQEQEELRRRSYQ